MKNKDIDRIIKDNFIIIIDTREKKNEHILQAFNKYGVKYKIQKLNYGDYSCIITKCEELGILEDIPVKIAIERKGSLQELGNNLTNAKERFHREMQRCKENNGVMIIMIENATYHDIVAKKYPNNISNTAYLGLLHGIYSGYDVPFEFVDKIDSPVFIYHTCKSFARKLLKNY